jgi:arginine deiminase
MDNRMTPGHLTGRGPKMAGQPPADGGDLVDSAATGARRDTAATPPADPSAGRFVPECAPVGRAQAAGEAAPAGFGCDVFGRLTRVVLHRPSPRALERITPANCHRWLFDDAPDIPRFIEEHDRYRRLLESLGVEVVELADHLDGSAETVHELPNLTYLHDIAVVSRQGAMLSVMASDARRGEHVLVGEALSALGVPVLRCFGDDDAFEGLLLLSARTLLVAETERHSAESVRRFIPWALERFEEVIHIDVPKARRYMHPDTIYNRVHTNLALAYLPAFRSAVSHTAGGARPIDFRGHMAERGVEIVNVSDSEQRRLACSFVPIQPGLIVHYDTALNKETRDELRRRGVEVIEFHPDALHAGGGSLRCLTLRLCREPA